MQEYEIRVLMWDTLTGEWESTRMTDSLYIRAANIWMRVRSEKCEGRSILQAHSRGTLRTSQTSDKQQQKKKKKMNLAVRY